MARYGKATPKSVPRHAIRLAFVILILFEAANTVHLLQIETQFTWLGLLLTSIFAFLGIELASYLLAQRQMQLHWSAWPLAFAMIAVDAGGDIFYWYWRYPWYDQIGHLLGSATVAVIILSIVAAGRRFSRLHDNDLLLTLGLAMVFGNLYEIEEYLEDVTTLSERLGDGPDTSNDLLMNLIGASLVVLICRLAISSSNRPRPGSIT